VGPSSSISDHWTWVAAVARATQLLTPRPLLAWARAVGSEALRAGASGFPRSARPRGAVAVEEPCVGRRADSYDSSRAPLEPRVAARRPWLRQRN